jgi:hypothetical protein
VLFTGLLWRVTLHFHQIQTNFQSNSNLRLVCFGSTFLEVDNMQISGMGSSSVSGLQRQLQAQHAAQAQQVQQQQVRAASSDPDHDGDVDGPGPDIDGKGGKIDIRA